MHTQQYHATKNIYAVTTLCLLHVRNLGPRQTWAPSLL